MNNEICDNILATIGDTPMVRINRLPHPAGVNIFAKLEGCNPSGSIKDRIAVKMIEAAEQDGRLRPGQTIIEPTSGNTGIALAVVGIVKGYPVEIVMSEAVSEERRKILRSYGAKVRLTPAAEGTDGAIREARRLRDSDPDHYFMPDQFSNQGNYMAHFHNTALEIWQQTGGKIDYLVSAIGTSGTIMGLSKFLKAMDPNIKTVCAQPVKGHYIQGLKNMEEAIVPHIYDPSQIDIQEMIDSEEAIEMARRLIREEGIFAGMSSGAAMLAALRTARKAGSGNIVVILPDRADKYLSTVMFEPFGESRAQAFTRFGKYRRLMPFTRDSTQNAKNGSRVFNPTGQMVSRSCFTLLRAFKFRPLSAVRSTTQRTRNSHSYLTLAALSRSGAIFCSSIIFSTALNC